MEVLAGLLVWVVLVVAVRRAWRSAGSPPTSAPPPWPPSSSPAAATRVTSGSTESADAAFVDGLIIGRHLGAQSQSPSRASSGFDELSCSDDVSPYDDSGHDDGGDW